MCPLPRVSGPWFPRGSEQNVGLHRACQCLPPPLTRVSCSFLDWRSRQGKCAPSLAIGSVAVIKQENGLHDVELKGEFVAPPTTGLPEANDKREFRSSIKPWVDA